MSEIFSFYTVSNDLKEEGRHQLTAPTIVDKATPAASPPVAAATEEAAAALFAAVDAALTAMFCMTCNL
jgi:hypothetical protein